MAWYGCSSTWRETTTIVECVHWLYHMAFRMSQSREKYLKKRDMSKIGIICHLVWSKHLKFVIIVTIDYLLSILSLTVQLTAVSIWKQCCLRLNWGVFTRGKVVKRFISHQGQSPSGKYYINITLVPRPKAEVLMKVYHISELENRILQRLSV